MFTILCTLVGLVVCLISMFTAGFKPALKRLGGFAITGLVLDVILTVALLATALFSS